MSSTANGRKRNGKLRPRKERRNVFNLGLDEFMNVLELAGCAEELAQTGVRYPPREARAVGLATRPFVHLDTTKLKALAPVAASLHRTGYP
jgi:hypothetical protein